MPAVSLDWPTLQRNDLALPGGYGGELTRTTQISDTQGAATVVYLIRFEILLYIVILLI